MATRITNNKTRLVMAQNCNAKVITNGDSTLYRVGETIVDDNGNLLTGSDKELWDAYQLAN